MWDTIVGVLQGMAAQATGGTSGVVGTLGVVWAGLTDYRMWRSLGWLLLGILLMVMGLVIWNRKAIGSAIQTAKAI